MTVERIDMFKREEGSDIADLLFQQHDMSTDIDFMNTYFTLKRWTSKEERQELHDYLSGEAKEVLAQILERK